MQTAFVRDAQALNLQLKRAVKDYTEAVQGLLRLHARVGEKYVPPQALVSAAFLREELGYVFCPDRQALSALVQNQMNSHSVTLSDFVDLPDRFPCWVDMIYRPNTHESSPDVVCITLYQEGATP